jgi:nucleoside-diphosphate-sugar epimerase
VKVWALSTLVDGKATLITGASGVIGSALLEAGRPVIALRHKRRMLHNVPEVRGDVRRHRLGMDRSQAHELKTRIKAVIHAAGLTNYDVEREEMRSVVVEGTERLIEFAEYAEVPIFYTSTVGLAFDDGLAGTADGKLPDSFSPRNYMTAKAEAEALLRAASVPTCAIRITWVIGDSQRGHIKRFQGLYLLAQALASDSIPLIPANPTDVIDFLPQDVVARAIWTLIDADRREGVVWLTAGDQGLLLRRALEIVVEHSAAIGIHVRVPRFVAPDIVERLIRPVFLEEFSERQRLQFEQMLALIGSVRGPLPSALPELLPGALDLESGLRRALEYWSTRKRLVRRHRARLTVRA